MRDYGLIGRGKQDASSLYSTEASISISRPFWKEGSKEGDKYWMGKEQIVEHSRAAETGFESTRSGAEEERKMAVAVNNHGMSAPDPSPEIHPTCQRHASRIRWPANMSWLPTHLFEMRRADGMPANSHPLPTADPLRSPRSPYTASPIYPDRAIRPLPSRRLKSKLSPEQASHIVYPPDPPAPPALPLAAGVHGEEGPRGGVRRPCALASEAGRPRGLPCSPPPP